MKKLSVITLLLLVGVTFMECRNNSSIGCPEAADRAVLSVMHSEFSGTPNYLSVWLNHGYDSEYWNPEFEIWQKNIDRTRNWASGINDRCTRNSYIGWLDYYQRELNSAREELRTQSQRKEMDEYHKQEALEREKSNDYAIKHKVPTPPKD